MSSISFDSFGNLLSRLGQLVTPTSNSCNTTPSLDLDAKLKIVQQQSTVSNLWVDAVIENNALIERTIELPATECFKYLPDLHGLSNQQEQTVLNTYELYYADICLDAQILANRYGTAYIYLNIIQGNLSDPVDLTQRYRLGTPVLLTHEEVLVHYEERKLYGEPQYYQIQTNTEFDTITSLDKVHSSRFLIFHGKKTRGEERRHYNYHSKPNWLSAFPQLVKYDLGLDAALNMLKDYDVFLYRLEGLVDKVFKAQCHDKNNGVNTEEDDLYNRLSQLVTGKSLTKALILDKNLEDGEFINRNYTGVNEIIDDLRRAYAERVDIPVSILFSSSQGNMFGGDTGLSDRYLFSSIINSKQRNDIKREHYKLFRYILGSDIPFTIEYRPTIELSHKEIADIDFQISKADASRVVARVMTPRQAARRYLSKQALDIHIQLSEADLQDIPNSFEVSQEGAGAVNRNISGNNGGSNTSN